MFGSKSKSTANHFDTLIANGTAISGDLTVSGGLHIDGKIEGQIKAAVDNPKAIVRVSEAGEVTGNIVAPHIVVNGKVNGDVYSSEHIELAAKASITGNVYYNLIEMAIGAEVNGNLVHQKEAQSKLQASVVRPISHAAEDRQSSGDKLSVSGSAKANS